MYVTVSKKHRFRRFQKLDMSAIRERGLTPLPLQKVDKIWALYSNSILIWVQKDSWVEEILLLKVWVKVGGGEYKLQVMDSHPVNKCIYIYFFIYSLWSGNLITRQYRINLEFSDRREKYWFR